MSSEGPSDGVLSQAQFEHIAQQLQEAQDKREQLPMLSAQYPGMTLADAYAVQRAWVGAQLTGGRRLCGHKIGLTSRAMQRSSNISEPDFGALLDSMFFEENGEVPFSRFIVPRVEIELAFVLERELSGPEVTVPQVLDATAYVQPAFEIIDARIQRTHPETGRTRTVLDTISDNAANAGVVLGGRPVRPNSLDLRWVAALCFKNGVIEETGVAAGVLNHPARGVAWLARKLAAYGETLKAGEVILSGSFIQPVTAQPGDTFHADYGPLGSVSFQFGD